MEDMGVSEYTVMAPTAGVAGVYQTRSLENPALSLSDPALWAEVFHDQIGTDSGVTINAEKALSYAPVWQAVNLLSGDVAKLPFEVFKRIESEGQRGRDVDKMHPAYCLVRRQANRRMSAFKFWRQLMVHVLLWNRAFAVIDRNGRGEPIGLYPLLPDRTTLHYDKDGEPFYVSEIDGQLQPFSASNILHLEGIDMGGADPCELLKNARHSWALGLAAEKFSSKFFSNGAQTGGILEIPTAYTKKAADNLEEGFRKKHSGLTAAFKTVILREGAKFHATQVEPAKAQMHELRQEQVREVARWYNIPPHKLNEGSQSSSYNSLEHENRAYLDTALSHWLNTIAAECWLKLLTTEEQQSDSHFFEHNTAALLQADISTTMEVLAVGIQWGVVSQNEARAKLNMNPREGGDVFLVPLNMVPSDEEEDEGQTPDPPEEPDEDVRGATLDALKVSVHQRLQAVVTSIQVAARKKADVQFIEWLDKTGEELRQIMAGYIRPSVRAVAVSHRFKWQRFADRLESAIISSLVTACRCAADGAGADLQRVVERECTAATEAVDTVVETVLGEEICD